MVSERLECEVTRGLSVTGHVITGSELVLLQIWTSSESVAFKLRPSLRGAGHVDVEHLIVDGWWCARRASHSTVWAGDWLRLVLGRVLPLCPVQRSFESGSRSRSTVGIGLRLETLQLDCVFGITGARQQDCHVFAELGAESEVDEGVVEAGGLGKEAGKNTGEVGHVEAPGRPHGNHGVRRPRQDEGRADHYGNLQETTHQLNLGKPGRNKGLCAVKTHDGDVSLDLPLAVGQVTVS